MTTSNVIMRSKSSTGIYIFIAVLLGAIIAIAIALLLSKSKESVGQDPQPTKGSKTGLPGGPAPSTRNNMWQWIAGIALAAVLLILFIVAENWKSISPQELRRNQPPSAHHHLETPSEKREEFNIEDYLGLNKKTHNPTYEEMYRTIYDTFGKNWTYLPEDVINNQNKMDNKEEFNEANKHNAMQLKIEILLRHPRDPTTFTNSKSVKMLVLSQFDARSNRQEVPEFNAEDIVDVYKEIYKNKIDQYAYVVLLDDEDTGNPVSEELSKTLNDKYVAVRISDVWNRSKDPPSVIYRKLNNIAKRVKILPQKGYF
jgi:hypothetical protein